MIRAMALDLAMQGIKNKNSSRYRSLDVVFNANSESSARLQL